MEYKGIQYTVVQTANPTGWHWAVDLPPPHKTRTGDTPRRDDAVHKAQYVIDRAVAAQRLCHKMENPSG
jgi:hypothetical protein